MKFRALIDIEFEAKDIDDALQKFALHFASLQYESWNDLAGKHASRAWYTGTFRIESKEATK